MIVVTTPMCKEIVEWAGLADFKVNKHPDNEDGDFAYSPVFDHGAGLLSDTTMDYPMGEDVYSLIKEVKAKTISRDFDEQLDVSENLYGYNLKFSFTKKDVSRLLNNAKIYDAAIRKRVETIMFIQMEKYAYLF